MRKAVKVQAGNRDLVGTVLFTCTFADLKTFQQ